MQRKGIDWYLVLSITALLLIGIFFIFSSSYYYAMVRFGDRYHFFNKTILFSAIGFLSMMIVAQIDYRKYRWGVMLAYGGGIFLLVYVLIFGEVRNGARRWLDVPFLPDFMPSEVMKIIVIMALAHLLTQKNLIKRSIGGYLSLGALIVIPAFLVLQQPNLSMAIIIGASGFGLLFLSDFNLLYTLVTAGGGVGAVYYIVTNTGFRQERLDAFKDPFAYALDTGYQTVQSLMALTSGKLAGVGLGQSLKNKLYIPEPHNDYILATIGEETGFIGVSLLILLFILLIYRIFKTALGAKDPYGFYIASGIGLVVAAQLIINVAVVTNTIPATGIPLPFISYGGTNLVVLLTAMGIVLNISKHQRS